MRTAPQLALTEITKRYGTRVVLEPRLHLVGYGPSASTVGANRAGREAVRDIRRLLATGASAPLSALSSQH